jgi:hypothetical protein
MKTIFKNMPKPAAKTTELLFARFLFSGGYVFLSRGMKPLKAAI